MAAVTQGQIKFKVEFDIVNSTFKFTDQTTYDDYTTVKGAIKIEYKGVTVWDNLANIETTPDIDGSSAGQANEALLRSNTTPTPLNLPTTLNGEYTVTYSIKEGAIDPISAAVTFDYVYVAPVGDLDATVDLTLTSPSIKIVDNTNYKVNSITPTGTPTIKMYYPADVDLPEVSEQTSLLTVTNFYTGTQIGVLDADKVWDYTSTVTDTTFTEGYATIFTLDTITDRINIPVESNGDICTIFCCLKDFENRLSLSKSNPTKYQELSDIAGKVGFYFSSILAAFECGKTENVNDWITEIRSLVDCNEDCGCDGSEPILISPINGETVGYNLTIDDGTTSVSNVTGVSFSGATLTDDGDGQVTVAISGGSNITVADNNGLALSVGDELSTTYNSTIGDAVESVEVGGISAGTTASTLKALNIVQVLDNILFPTILAYISQNKSVSLTVNSPTGVLEIGTSSSRTLTANFVDGQITNGDGTTGPDLVGAASQYTFSGTSMMETSQAGNQITITHTVIAGSNSWAVTVNHAEGTGDYTDNKGVVGTNLDGSRVAGTVTDNASSPSITGVYPVFWWKDSSPITASGMATAIASGDATKMVVTSTGTITIDFNATGEYLAVAYPATSTTKTAWYISELDKGTIPGGLFDGASTQSVTSPDGYWSSISYKIHVSPGLITQSEPIQLRN